MKTARVVSYALRVQSLAAKYNHGGSSRVTFFFTNYEAKSALRLRAEGVQVLDGFRKEAQYTVVFSRTRNKNLSHVEQ
jgi:hypothetical protein